MKTNIIYNTSSENMQNCTNRLSGRYENILWGVKDINNYIFKPFILLFLGFIKYDPQPLHVSFNSGISSFMNILVR